VEGRRRGAALRLSQNAGVVLPRIKRQTSRHQLRDASARAVAIFSARRRYPVSVRPSCVVIHRARTHTHTHTHTHASSGNQPVYMYRRIAGFGKTSSASSSRSALADHGHVNTWNRSTRKASEFLSIRRRHVQLVSGEWNTTFCRRVSSVSPAASRVTDRLDWDARVRIRRRYPGSGGQKMTENYQGNEDWLT